MITRLAVENLFHPFQPFILGQKNFAPKLASFYDIPLIFYGENEAEYGNPLADNSKSLRDKSYHTMNKIDQSYLAGLPIKDILNNYPINNSDLKTFLPLEADQYEKTNECFWRNGFFYTKK